MPKTTLHFAGSLLVFSLLLSGCGSSGDGSSSGTVNIGVTDAPLDNASAVVITFVGVEMKRDGGAPITLNLNSPQQIDLLNLQGSDFAFLVENRNVQAGDYQWLRLKVLTSQNSSDDSYIQQQGDDRKYPLYIPSGDETGLKLNQGFTVPQGGQIDLTVDIDLRKSIVAPQNNSNSYRLKPSLRLVQNNQAGHIQGSVDTTLLTNNPQCAAAVYLYAGHNITADDYGNGQLEPLSSALISYDQQRSEYRYQLGYIPAGNYTLAFTCQAGLDEVDTDDEISFLSSANSEVTAEQTTTTHISL